MYYYSIDAEHLVDVGILLRSVDLCRYLSISVSEDTHGMTSSTSTPGLRPLTLLLLLHSMHVTTTSGVCCCGRCKDVCTTTP